MTIPPYLHRTGLPASVLYTIHILSNADQLEALRLVRLFETRLNTIDRAEIERVAREREAKQALIRRELELKRKPLSVAAIRVSAAERSLLR